MRLFYEHGKAQVSMSLEEFTAAIKEAGEATPLMQATATVNGSKTRSAGVGRKRVARVAKRSRRMVSRRPMKRHVTQRFLKEAQSKATTKPKRKVAKRDWGPIIAKRNRTIAEKKAQQQPAAEPMAAAQ